MRSATQAAIRDYLAGYYAQSEDCERFDILSVGRSTAQVRVKYALGEPETVEWSFWHEQDGASVSLMGGY